MGNNLKYYQNDENISPIKILQIKVNNNNKKKNLSLFI